MSALRQCPYSNHALVRLAAAVPAADRIAASEIIGDPERLKEMDLAVLGE